MARDPEFGPEEERPQGAGPTDPAPDDDDTEGHSLGMVLGMNELFGRAREDTTKSRRSEEELKPLTKHWPRLRDEKRR